MCDNRDAVIERLRETLSLVMGLTHPTVIADRSMSDETADMIYDNVKNTLDATRCAIKQNLPLR